MPVHDWTRVTAGIFHDFHLSWIAEIKRTLNQGILPPAYYALAEQLTGGMGPDVLTLCKPISVSLAGGEASAKGGIAVAKSPPTARFHARAEVDLYAKKAKTVVIRHSSNHQVIAMIEIVSPGNKNGQTDLAAFVRKAEQALLAGIHLLIVDLFPPTPRDPEGIHRAIWGEGREGDFALPADKRLTCVSYVGYPCVEVFLEPVAVGDKLPKMPLFLSPEMYVLVPLEDTYRSAWEAVPAIWREALTAAKPPGNGRGKSRGTRR
jgi:Protein of unknown function (DUF4058)